MKTLDPLTYEVLRWLAAGNAVFRPREATADAEHEFRSVVASLATLREDGLLSYRDAHVSATEGGIFLAVGPVHLTDAGRAALDRDQRLGARPPWAGALPWRT